MGCLRPLRPPLPPRPPLRPPRRLRRHLPAGRHRRPWRDLPEAYGKPDTISRYFRRLAHEGFWERILLARALVPEAHPLKNLLGLICRAARRAIRIRGLRIILLARRLNLKRALPAPPWMCPDPDLSEILFALQLKHLPTIR